MQWHRVLSRSRFYSGPGPSATACGFLEVGELVCVEVDEAAAEAAQPEVDSDATATTGESDASTAAVDGVATDSKPNRVRVRKQRGGLIGWASVVNPTGKVMMQSVSTLARTGVGGNDDSGRIGSLGGWNSSSSSSSGGIGNGKHYCTEAERLFSIELLQGRLQEDAVALAGSTKARMAALRELLDSKEAELLREIQQAADTHAAQLQHTKELCGTSRRVDLPASLMDPERFLGELDGCMQQITGLTVMLHASGTSAGATGEAPSSELPRDLRGLGNRNAGVSSTGTDKAASHNPSEAATGSGSGRTPLRAHRGSFRQSMGANSSPAIATTPPIDASLDLRSELSPSPISNANRSSIGSSSSVGSSPVSVSGDSNIVIGGLLSTAAAAAAGTGVEAQAAATMMSSTPQQPERSARGSPSPSTSLPASSSPSSSSSSAAAAASSSAQKRRGRGGGNGQHSQPRQRLINLPIASGSASATRTIQTPSKQRRMDAFRKSSSSSSAMMPLPLNSPAAAAAAAAGLTGLGSE